MSLIFTDTILPSKKEKTKEKTKEKKKKKEEFAPGMYSFDTNTAQASIYWWYLWKLNKETFDKS